MLKYQVYTPIPVRLKLEDAVGFFHQTVLLEPKKVQGLRFAQLGPVGVEQISVSENESKASNILHSLQTRFTTELASVRSTQVSLSVSRGIQGRTESLRLRHYAPIGNQLLMERPPAGNHR